MFVPTLIAAAALAPVPEARAQDAAEALPRAVVAVVDLTRVSEESLVGQDLSRQLAELQATVEADLSGKRTRIEEDQTRFEQEVEAFQSEREQLSDAEIQARETALLERQQGLQEVFQAAQVDAEAAQRRLQNERDRLMAELDRQIRPHLNSAAADLGIDILLPMSQTIFAQPQLDITDQVIERVNRAFEAGSEPQ
jgi:Skp family chaperone for outer membrane proteins